MKLNSKFQVTTHPFHMVKASPWPILTAFSAFATTMGATMYFHYSNVGLSLLVVGFIGLLICAFLWWGDVIYEAHNEGEHTLLVQRGLRYGVVLFILSEIFFFLSFFWAFFHSSLSPSVDLAFMWPPRGIHPFCPVGVPFLNTIILLLSGAFITWSHHSLEESRRTSIFALGWTIALAITFTGLQYYEYGHASFSLNDGVYGSLFFFLTGFHGLHVIIGTIFLIVCFIRLFNDNFRKGHYVGFEAAIWYWHFVDVVWLFLFLSIYWWGGNMH